MRKYSQFVVLLILYWGCTFRVSAQDQDEIFINTVNSNWVSTNYTLILSNINARLQTNSSDVLALSLKMHYYTFCDNNVTNAHEAANLFTNVVNASARTEMIPFAQVMAQRFLDIPLSESVPFSEAARNEVHSLFPDGFPGVEECEAFSLSLNGRRDLHVQSVNPSTGVPIKVAPYEEMGQETATTSFDRVYYKNTAVTLTAPTSVSGKGFNQWNKDGTSYVTNVNVTITISNSVTMTAVYAP